MEVVALSGGNNNAPFKREVHEWQHVDAKTGALLSGRLEADRFVNGNTNTYGKVSGDDLKSQLLKFKFWVKRLARKEERRLVNGGRRRSEDFVAVEKNMTSTNS